MVMTYYLSYDQIHQGPKLQRDLFDVLLRFRRYQVAVIRSVEEMNQRILTAHADKPYHRFLWREIDRGRSPDVFEFDRVVFVAIPGSMRAAATCEVQRKLLLSQQKHS